MKSPPLPSCPQKIMIFGRPGSGKSTFALMLHQRTHIHLYHLDQYFFVENWIERDYQEFLAIQEELVKQDQWIIDGNCTQSLEMRYAQADLVFYFNYPRWQCYWRIIKRFFKKNPEIQDRAEGCHEVIHWKFLKYTWTFEQHVAEQIRLLREKYPNAQFVEICNDQQLRNIKNSLL